MNERTIIDFLSYQNEWWDKKENFPFRKIYNFKRSDYYHLKEVHLEKDKASVIVGPRGVGKSTVLLELIRELIGFPENAAGENIDAKTINAEPKIEPERILYASFEESQLQKLGMLELLEIYSKYVLKEDLRNIKEKIYIFFDEIQYLKNWGDQVKIIQDLKLPIKMFLCGSSSVAMRNEASRAARRIEMYSMHPLKFSDFVRYHIRDEELTEKLKEIKRFRTTFIEEFRRESSEEVYERFLQFYRDLKPWQTKIELLFEEYMIKGGYPELLEEKDYSVCAKNLRETFDLGFHKDLVLAKGIGQPEGMRDLLEYIAAISSWETNYSSLSEGSGLNTNSDVIKRYLYHLEKGYLIGKSERHRGSRKKSSNFKIYLTDVAIRNMLRGFLNELLLENDEEVGKVLETIVFDHMIRLYYKIRPDMPVQYVRERGGKEVDLLLQLNGEAVPIEVKKSDNPGKSDIEGLLSFCEGDKPGIVSCGKRLDIKDNIIFLPHWLLVLIC